MSFGPEELRNQFLHAAGREVRWTVAAPGIQRTLEGRIPPSRRWREGEPVLVLRPGAMDGVHVLAEMELRLVVREGIYFLARRRWYEADDLDLTRLGPEPPMMNLEVLR